MRIRTDLRSGWRGWTAVALLIGLFGTAVLASAAGARRTDTAYARLLKSSKAADVVVSPQDTGLGGYYAALAHLPGVAAIGAVAGIELFTPGEKPQHIAALASVDSRFGTVVERPRIVEGAMYDPRQPGQAVAERNLAQSLHLRAGSVLHLFAGSTGPDGPDLAHARPVTLHIVGIAVTRDDVVSVNAISSQPTLLATPAFLQQFDSSVFAFDGVYVRLRPGASRASFEARAQELASRFPETGTRLFLADEHQQASIVERAIRPQAAALAIFALLLGLTGLLIVGQVATRQMFVTGNEYHTLRALGMSQRQLTAVGLAEVGMAAAAGTLLAVVAAAVVSPLTPIGPARIAEPQPGLAANWAVLGGGAVTIFVLILALVAVWSLAASTRQIAEPTQAADLSRPSRLVGAIAGMRVPVSASVGVHLALQPGRGRASVPTRSAVGGLIVAIAALTAAFTFGANLFHLLDTPHLYGQTWSTGVDAQFGVMPAAKTEQFLRQQAGAIAWTFGNHGTVSMNGDTVPSIGVTAGRGPTMWPTILEGRSPRTSDEILLGTKTLKTLHRHVGQTVDVTAEGQSKPRAMRIVGRAVFPFFGRGSFTPTGLGEGAALNDPTPNPTGFNFFLMSFRSGHRGSQNTAALSDNLRHIGVCPADQFCNVFDAQRPLDLNNYGRVRDTPLALSGILALLAVATLAHLLLVSTVRRRRDLAVFKTLGFVRRQLTSAVAWQASVLVAVALVIGLPLGLAAGRLVWRAFATRLGVATGAVVPVPYVLLTIATTFLVANALAVGPGLVAARRPVGPVLRSE